jgi:hypothetical protein
MGQIAAAVIVLAGAVALGHGAYGKESLNAAGVTGLALVLLGGGLYLAETVRAWRRPKA